MSVEEIDNPMPRHLVASQPVTWELGNGVQATAYPEAGGLTVYDEHNIVVLNERQRGRLREMLNTVPKGAADGAYCPHGFMKPYNLNLCQHCASSSPKRGTELPDSAGDKP